MTNMWSLPDFKKNSASNFKQGEIKSPTKCFKNTWKKSHSVFGTRQSYGYPNSGNCNANRFLAVKIWNDIYEGWNVWNKNVVRCIAGMDFWLTKTNTKIATESVSDERAFLAASLLARHFYSIFLKENYVSTEMTILLTLHGAPEFLNFLSIGFHTWWCSLLLL